MFELVELVVFVEGGVEVEDAGEGFVGVYVGESGWC